MFKNTKLIIKENSIVTDENLVVMHDWETELMKRKADFICENGGDILEIGFGMGICSNFIQGHQIKTHTICEIHPQIIPILKTWAKDKPNVKILEGCWWDSKGLLDKYDGIIYDAYLDVNHSKLRKVIPEICNKNARFTWWNNSPKERDEHKLGGVTYERFEVNPVENDYFNHKKYFMPKYIHNE